MKLLLLASALSLATAWPAVAAGTLREFGKWRVACDNAGHCAAFGTPSEDPAEPRAGLRISRDSGHDARIRISFDGKDPLAKETVWLGAKPFSNRAAKSGSQAASGNEAALALVSGMLDATTFALAEKPDPDETISLTGLKAALLYIDDVQGRVGSRNAFVARGDKSAARKFAGYPLVKAARLPGADPADAADPAAGNNPSSAGDKAVMQFHQRRADKKVCHVDMNGEDGERKPGDWHPLGPSLMLAEVYCWRAAYQTGSVYYLYDSKSGAVRPAPFEQLDPESGRLTIGPLQSVTSPDFSQGAIHSMHKLRGVGGCGEQTGWTWDGKVFRLTHQAIKFDCGYSDAGLRLHGARVQQPDGTIADVEQDGLDEGY